jgi:hypothetical protein
VVRLHGDGFEALPFKGRVGWGWCSTRDKESSRLRRPYNASRAFDSAFVSNGKDGMITGGLPAWGWLFL